MALAAGMLDAAPWTRLLLNLASVYLAWRAAVAASTPLNPMSLYLPAAGLYIYSGAIDTLFGGLGQLPLGAMLALMDYGTVFVFVAAAAWSMVGTGSAPRNQTSAADAIAATRVSTLLFIAAAATAVSRYGLSIGQLDRGELYSNEFILLSVLRSLLSASLVASAAMIVSAEKARGGPLKHVRNTFWLVFLGYFLLDLALLGDRRLALMTLCGALVLMRPQGPTRRQVAWGLVMLLMLHVYGSVRNTPVSSWASTLASSNLLLLFNPVSVEFGNGAVIIDALGSNPATAPDFPSYLSGFQQIVPRALLPSRPEAPTEWFVRSYLPAVYDLGGSLAFNAAIEAYLNARYAGLVLAGAAMGTTMALLCRVHFRGARVGLGLCAYVTVFSMRMDFASLLRTTLQALAAFVLTVAAAYAWRWLAVAIRPAARA